MKKSPSKIYLQACDECYEDSYHNGVTYCENYIGHDCDAENPKDTAYIRESVIITRLRAVVEEIEDDVDDYSKERPQFYEGFNQGLHKCIDKLRLAFPELSEEENDD